MLFAPKDLKMTLGILSLDANSNSIQRTINSSKFLTFDCDKVVAIPQETVLSSSLGINVINGGNCITSMMDNIVKNIKTEWVYFVFAGTNLRKAVDQKNSMYVESYRDVLFPVVDRIWNFVDGSMNGLLISKQFYQEVGDFGSGKNLQVTKLLWAEKAMAIGGRFKGIVGAVNI